MKKDSYSQLFSDYKPKLAPTARFMSRLNRGLDSVEIIKRREVSIRRRRRAALAVAFVTGMIAGVVGTLCLPYLVEWFSGLHLPEVKMLPQISLPLLLLVLSWLVVGGGSILLALQGYGAASAVLEARERR